MHYIRDRKVPSNILKLFSDTTSIHSYNTRSSLANKFYIKKSRLEIQKRAFSRVGAKILNEMPASLRELYKKPFQTKFHSFLLDILKKHDDYIDILGEQGWRSGESARLPPMCPGFDSRTRRHMWAEFVASLLCSERFFSGNSGFPLSSKTNI